MGSPDVPAGSSINSKSHWSLPAALADVPKPVTSLSSSPLALLHVLERLKTTQREGWRRFNIPNPESISDHMYRMSIISMLCPDPSINRDHCVKMAIVHDMAESLVGDITPIDGISKDEKHSRELQTMEYLTQSLLAPSNAQAAEEILALWNEYENGATPEAIFVKDVDKFELLCQMVEYEKRSEGSSNLAEFVRVSTRLKTDYVKKWASDLLEERDQFWNSVQGGRRGE